MSRPWFTLAVLNVLVPSLIFAAPDASGHEAKTAILNDQGTPIAADQCRETWTCDPYAAIGPSSQPSIAPKSLTWNKTHFYSCAFNSDFVDPWGSNLTLYPKDNKPAVQVPFAPPVQTASLPKAAKVDEAKTDDWQETYWSAESERIASDSWIYESQSFETTGREYWDYYATDFDRTISAFDDQKTEPQGYREYAGTPFKDQAEALQLWYDDAGLPRQPTRFAAGLTGFAILAKAHWNTIKNLPIVKSPAEQLRMVDHQIEMTLCGTIYLTEYYQMKYGLESHYSQVAQQEALKDFGRTALLSAANSLNNAGNLLQRTSQQLQRMAEPVAPQMAEAPKGTSR